MPGAGDVVNPGDFGLGILAHHERSTAGSISGVTTTETGFVRIDSIPVRDGYTYEVIVPRVIFTLSATTVSAMSRLRGSTSGAATNASTLLRGGEIRSAVPPDTSNTDMKPLIGYFYSTTNGNLSVIWTVIRATAAGTVGLFASGGNPVEMVVKEIGITPADNGVDL